MRLKRIASRLGSRAEKSIRSSSMFCLLKQIIRQVLAQQAPSDKQVLAVEGSVAHRGEKPTGEAIRLATLIQPMQCPHESLLSNVLGIRSTTNDRQRHNVGGAQITPDEELQCRNVAAPRAGDEDRVLRFHSPTITTVG